jgi:hypothetical protein
VNQRLYLFSGFFRTHLNDPFIEMGPRDASVSAEHSLQGQSFRFWAQVASASFERVSSTEANGG